MNSIENISIQTYLKNLEYFKVNHNEIYKKIELFQIAIESNIIKEKFELRYQNNYFDIYDFEQNIFLYNTNSIKYSKELVFNINFNAKKILLRLFMIIHMKKRLLEKQKKHQYYHLQY